jgi:hypothetical protein
MPSIRTAYAWLIAMGFLGVIGLPIIFGFGIYISWDALSTGAIITQVTGMLISVFSSMCGVVVLKQLEAQYLQSEDAKNESPKKESPKKESPELDFERVVVIAMVTFVIAAVVGAVAWNSTTP